MELVACRSQSESNVSNSQHLSADSFRETSVYLIILQVSEERRTPPEQFTRKRRLYSRLLTYSKAGITNTDDSGCCC